MNNTKIDPASFRDPGGHVFVAGDRVYRTVNAPAVEDFDFVEASGLIADLTSWGWLVASDRVDASVLGADAGDAVYVVEHPRLPFITYPYEWPFSTLKAAALLHLDIHLKALEYDVTLSDASAYNIQFIGAKPVFIDRLSFVRYREGQIWAGYKQFCEQFLNPLLLRAFFGITHNSWYRGALEGIPTDALRRMLPWRRKLSPKVFTHVVLQSALQSSATKGNVPLESKTLKAAGLPRPALKNMLKRLRSWIESLMPADTGKTVWQDYAVDNSYTPEEAAAKKRFITDFCAASSPKMVWDFGCNAGDHLVAAFEGGAQYGVGFDFDQGALEACFARAAEQGLPIQTVFLDAANPTSGGGWNEKERHGLKERASADAVLALAFVHHLAIAKNIPLDRFLEWVIGFAPTGVIEFVPKADPMVKRLLALRQDIFDSYNEEAFLAGIERRAKIVKQTTVSASGRKLAWYAT